MRRVWHLLIVLFAVAGTAANAAACSVPVFRYALERWPADLYEVDVFFRGTLTDQAAVAALEDRALRNGGQLNWEIVPCNVAGSLDADLQTVWEGLSDPALPYVVLRSPGGRQGSPILWTGPLSAAASSLAVSGPERELVRRLLAGDAVVWVVLRGTDESAADGVVTLLSEQLAALREEIELPPGVGLPGSELLAQIPLEIRFSVLDVAAKEAANSLLRRAAMGRCSEPVDEQTTLVVPVFGRGRAVQVLTAAEVDADLIAEISRFLCGACSCQVKQLNPGFDLLLSVSWDERLFGDAAPVDHVVEVPSSEATFVQIPSGQARAPTMTARPADRADEAANRAADDAENRDAREPPAERETDWYLLAACVLIVAVVYAWRRQAAWSRRDRLDDR